MFLLAKYGVQTIFTFPMVKRASVDLAGTADWTPATGDTKISKDGGNVANTTNNPAAVGGTGSVSWTLTLTSTELQAAVIDIQIVDSAAKAVEDQFLKIYTYGHASARIQQDLSVDLVARIPAALVSGRIDASVGAMATDVVNAAATAADFLAEINAECDTALADYDAPTFAELDARTDAIEADTQDIQARIPAALVSGRMDASVGAVAANAINDAAVAADMDSYTAKIWVIKEGTTADHYAVRWFKNGVPITSGITVPTIQVIKGSDGTDLIASTAMTEIGSTHRFKKDETTNKMVAGQIYFAVVTATIDGSSRSFEQQVGRDSG